MTCWDFIHLEGHCFYETESKKTKKYCSFEDLEKKDKAIKWRKEKNKDYISKSKRPKWCVNQNKKLIPQFRCFGRNKINLCPFFAFTHAYKNDIDLFEKAWELNNKE